MTNEVSQSEENVDYVRYIKEHLETDLKTNSQLRGEQGALECVAGQAFLVSSAVVCRPHRSVKRVWMDTGQYARQHELRLSETQKAIIAVEKLDDAQLREIFDYMGEYSGKVF